jgi:hypothetical protein
MLASYFAAIVDFCIRRGPLIIAMATILGLGSAVYVERHFTVNSNVHKLLSPNLPWVKRDAEYMAAFPQQATSILAGGDGAHSGIRWCCTRVRSPPSLRRKKASSTP